MIYDIFPSVTSFTASSRNSFVYLPYHIWIITQINEPLKVGYSLGFPPLFFIGNTSVVVGINVARVNLDGFSIISNS